LPPLLTAAFLRSVLKKRIFSKIFSGSYKRARGQFRLPCSRITVVGADIYQFPSIPFFFGCSGGRGEPDCSALPKSLLSRRRIENMRLAHWPVICLRFSALVCRLGHSNTGLRRAMRKQ